MTEQHVMDSFALRNRTGVFADRAEAGEALADMLAAHASPDAIVLAIPAGGVPVAAAVAAELDLPLDVAVVSKVTPSFNSEVGYGAVAWDGRIELNEEVAPHLGLSPAQVQDDVAKTQEKVRRRMERLRGKRPISDLSGREAILVDDGLASGFTMCVAVRALRDEGASRIVVAVPTAHGEAVRRVARIVEAVFCPNIRSGMRFAVADAYRDWSDVGEDEAARILRSARKRAEGRRS